MRIWAITKRIVHQMLKDKRSLALMMIAPLLILTLLWAVLDNDAYEPKIAYSDLPGPFVDALKKTNAKLKQTDLNEAKKLLEDKAYDAYLEIKTAGGKPELKVLLEGSDLGANASVQQAIAKASKEMAPDTLAVQNSYLHGSSDLSMFDHTGQVMIGFFIFFFVFIVGGVSFLRERTQGTLERILSTPLKRWELVCGYIAGFGIFIILQAVVITLYSIYVLGIYNSGSILSVLLIDSLLAITALTLGTVLSAFAKNELQMMQFIPLIIVPQVFFSGIFHIESIGFLTVLGKIMPLAYGSDALSRVMMRGESIASVLPDIGMLAGFALLFVLLNILALKRHRAL